MSDDLVAQQSPRAIVVGVDGSASAIAALRWARVLAAATGDPIEAVAAWTVPVNLGWSAWPAGWDPELETEKLLNLTVDEVFGEQRPADLTLSVQEGYPAKVLLDASRSARMLVLGSRGHGGFAGLLLGSVSASCAEHAACPVLVVHGDEVPGLAPPVD